MREILFRGKDEGTQEWVYGFYCEKPSPFHIGTEYSIFDNKTISRYTIRPETVCQYTGLIDKNGIKIFEGDVLSTENGTFSNTGRGHICSYKGMWVSFYGQDAIGRDCFDELYTVCKEREIVGNIYDNKELLESEETEE